MISQQGDAKVDPVAPAATEDPESKAVLPSQCKSSRVRPCRFQKLHKEEEVCDEQGGQGVQAGKRAVSKFSDRPLKSYARQVEDLRPRAPALD
eukprot:4663335-Prymnesium_polylepis.2